MVSQTYVDGVVQAQINRQQSINSNNTPLYVPSSNIQYPTEGEVKGSSDEKSSSLKESESPTKSPSFRPDLLKDELDAFIDNPLNEYQNWTYNWTFFMVSPENWNKTGSDTMLGDGTPKIVIAESGTTGYSIKSVEMKHTIGPNFATNTQNALEITMHIVEPAGVTLFDRIYGASMALGILNYTKGAFFLGLKFLGYDTNGNIINPLPVKYIEGQTWVWSIFIKDIHARFENGVGYYEITAIGTPSLTDTNNAALLKTHYNATPANNIEELLGNGPGGKPGEFEIFLNNHESQYRRTKEALNKYKIIVHYESWPDGWPKDKRTLTHNNSKYSNPNRGVGAFALGKNGKMTSQIPERMKIEQVINLIMMNSPYIQAIGNRTNNNDAGDTADKKNQFSQLWRIETEVKLLDFDLVFNDYTREYIYHVYHYDSPRVVLNPQVNPGNEAGGNPNINLMQEDVQRKRIKEIIGKGYLSKRYDYIYTGLNTEVLNLEIKFESMWTAVQAIFAGTRDYGNAHAPAKIYDPSRARYLADTLIKENKMVEEALQIRKLLDIAEYSKKAAFGEQVISTDREGNQRVYRVGADPDFESVLAEGEAAEKEAQRRIQNIEAQQRAIQQAQEAVGLSGPIDKRIYIEELKVDFRKLPPVPITMSQEDRSSERHGNQSSDEAYARGRSLLSSTLNQVLSGHTPKDLMNINLEIRGDPYWLGIGNIDKHHYSSTPSTPKVPNIKLGEHMFFLMFKMPVGFDKSGELQFDYEPVEQSQVICGLYSVLECISKFEDGKFTQSLKAIRDMNTNTNNVLK